MMFFIFIATNVCVCAVVGFRSRHCPRGQTLNEDNTYSLHVTPPLLKHFVSGWHFHLFLFTGVFSVVCFLVVRFAVEIDLTIVCPFNIFSLSLIFDNEFVYASFKSFFM